MLSAPAAPRRRSPLRVRSSRIICSKRRSNSLVGRNLSPPRSGHLGRVGWRWSALATIRILDYVDVLVRPGEAYGLAGAGHAPAGRLVGVGHEHGHRRVIAELDHDL